MLGAMRSLISKKNWSDADWNKLGYVDSRMDHLPLFSFARPHMRSMHTSWFAFFCCFFVWFSIPPLLETIIKPRCESADSDTCNICALEFPTMSSMAADKVCRVCAPRADGLHRGCGGLGLSENQIIVSNVVSVAGTILVRFFVGSAADRFGIRASFSTMLFVFAIPGFAACAMNSYESFIAIRFLISFVGGSFVLSQMWTTAMFHDSVVGTANAVSAGLGNSGAGVALAVISATFKHFKGIGFTNEEAWRHSLAWPPAILVALGFWILFCTDDCPYGPFSEICKRREENFLAPTRFKESFLKAAANWRTWVLFCLYGCSFGFMLVAHNNISLYFSRAFGMSQSDSAQVGSLVGFVSFLGRPLGGYLSDYLHKRSGMRGRLWALFICTLSMGVCNILFSFMTNDKGGRDGVVGCLAAWGLTMSMTCGAIYSVVPFVEPEAMGGVMGIVSAGGNVGALLGNWLLVVGDRPGFLILGYFATISATAVPLLWMTGHGSMFREYKQLLRSTYKMSAQEDNGVCCKLEGGFVDEEDSFTFAAKKMPFGPKVTKSNRAKFVPSLSVHVEMHAGVESKTARICENADQYSGAGVLEEEEEEENQNSPAGAVLEASRYSNAWALVEEGKEEKSNRYSDIRALVDEDISQKRHLVELEVGRMQSSGAGVK